MKTLTLTVGEVQLAIKKAEVGKATRIDNLSHEVLKSPMLSHILHGSFKKCFEMGRIPSVWLRSIINLIPKSQSDDARVPLNYGGISLLSTVYKSYSFILNNRLISYLEKKHLLVDEQNSIRKDRACINHLYTLCTIIRNRLEEKKPAFACFIDFKKSFDFVNKNLLLYRLLEYGVNGKFYKSIQSLYSAPIACVRINEFHTGWFPTPLGVKQGDNLSPTLFAVYINDLACAIKSLNCGVWCGEVMVSTHLYADDIVIMAENDWCKKWRLSINEGKTKMMHFRSSLSCSSKHQLYLGE